MDWLPPACAQTEPASQACALTGSQTHNLLVSAMLPNQLSHTGQGWALFLNVGATGHSGGSSWGWQQLELMPVLA